MAYSASLHFIGTVNHYARPITETFRLAKTVYSYTAQKVVAFLKAVYRFASLVAQMTLLRYKFFFKELVTRKTAYESYASIMEGLHNVHAGRFRQHYSLTERNPSPVISSPTLFDRPIQTRENQNGEDHFTPIPAEMIDLILSLLPPKELCRMEQVSIKFNQISGGENGNRLWKKHFQENFGSWKNDEIENWKEAYKFFSIPEKGEVLGKITITDPLSQDYEIPFYSSTNVDKLKVRMCKILKIDLSYAASIDFFEEVFISSFKSFNDLPNDLLISEIKGSLFFTFNPPLKTH